MTTFGPGSFTYTVPADVTTVTVDAAGAAGGTFEPQFRGSKITYPYSSTTVLSQPPAALVGDVMMMWMLGNGTVTVPAGWTLVVNETSSTLRLRVWWKLTTSSADFTPTVTGTAGSGQSLGLVSIRGCSTTPTNIGIVNISSPTTSPITVTPPTTYTGPQQQFVFWHGTGGGGPEPTGREYVAQTTIPYNTNISGYRTGGSRTVTYTGGPTSFGILVAISFPISGFLPVLPGKGARVQCDIPVTPGQTLNVVVGQLGRATGAFPDGGTSYDIDKPPGGGGSSTQVLSGATKLVIAGGGGGAGTGGVGGDGGLIGYAGSGTGPGQGGTATVYGAGGAIDGYAGTSTRGGPGSVKANQDWANGSLNGGGGGGGLRSGGGGGYSFEDGGSGGGGGSSLSTDIASTVTDAYNVLDGYLLITPKTLKKSAQLILFS